jgi:hypothetical protein
LALLLVQVAALSSYTDLLVLKLFDFLAHHCLEHSSIVSRVRHPAHKDHDDYVDEQGKYAFACTG